MCTLLLSYAEKIHHNKSISFALSAPDDVAHRETWIAWKQQLRDLYLNDNNLDGGIPERMVANCDRLQRLYLGGNRLTGTIPCVLRNLRDLRELNIERNNFHGEVSDGAPDSSWTQFS